MMTDLKIIYTAMAFGLIAGLATQAKAGELVVDAAVDVASTMPIDQSAEDAANQSVFPERLRLHGSGVAVWGTYGDLGLQKTALEISGANQIIGVDVPLALSF